MNGKEPWYMKPGWRSGWGFAVYLIFLPAILVGTAAVFGGYYLFSHILERYEWVFSILWAIAIIPWGWLAGPVLVIGATVVPGIYLCFFIHRHTNFGKTTIGMGILFYAGLTLAAVGIGIFYGFLNVYS